MIHIAPGWELDVERGPDWLFVRPHGTLDDASEAPPLGEEIWALLEQNLSHRLVLELDRIELLRSCLIGQLVWLYKRIHANDGVMRICGLSPTNRNVLRTSRLEERFPNFADREQAVMGSWRPQPR